MYVGIDLAGKEENPTGFAILNKNIITKKLFSDDEIINEIENIKPDIIGIDAPFSFPKKGYWRESDLHLKRNGFRPLSPRFPSMKILVRRAQRLIEKLQDLQNYKIIEVFPRATEKILFLNKEFFENKLGKKISKDEYDAILAAIIAKFYFEGKFRIYGKNENDMIVVPYVYPKT
jgi:predicted nuclease with RNAse H fold